MHPCFCLSAWRRIQVARATSCCLGIVWRLGLAAWMICPDTSLLAEDTAETCVSSAAAKTSSAPARQPLSGEQPRSLVWKRNEAGQPIAVVVQGLESAQLQALRALSGDDERWPQIFTVGVSAPNQPLIAMLGTYHVTDACVRFEPRYPLRANVAYRAVFRPAAAPGSLHAGHPELSADLPPLPSAVVPTTRLTHVYPTADVLPENQLKFYLYFSAPMSRGEAYQRVTLLDEQGMPVEHPFLELGEELWDPSGTRFTLLLDPGRIKRGLQPRELFGPALEEGRRYTLEIASQWLDAEGRPLVAAVRKSFLVAAPDDVQPDLNKWRVTLPNAGTRQPLIVRFPEPLDQAMLQRVLRVESAAGQLQVGSISVSARETVWSWTPDQNWQPGRYLLRIDGNLEDLAGNSLERPFEVDAFDRVDKQVEETVFEIPFDIRATTP